MKRYISEEYVKARIFSILRGGKAIKKPDNIVLKIVQVILVVIFCFTVEFVSTFGFLVLILRCGGDDAEGDESVEYVEDDYESGDPSAEVISSVHYLDGIG